MASVTTAGRPACLIASGEERLASERVRLGHDEVDAGLDRPLDLLVEDPRACLWDFDSLGS